MKVKEIRKEQTIEEVKKQIRKQIHSFHGDNLGIFANETIDRKFRFFSADEDAPQPFMISGTVVGVQAVNTTGQISLLVSVPKIFGKPLKHLSLPISSDHPSCYAVIEPLESGKDYYYGQLEWI